MKSDQQKKDLTVLDIPLKEARAQLASGALATDDYAEGFLARMMKLNSHFSAYTAIDGDRLRALVEANCSSDESDARPLGGIPVAVKDIIETVDYTTTYGSPAFELHRPEHDATCVERLKDAGAIILGKTNTFEFAMLSLSPLFGASLNPWDEERLAGGSSNGSATAVAAGLAPAALGTDTAGSIRNPSSYCGLVGLKPTHGRVSIKGVSCLAYSMDTVGPMTRTVADAAMILNAIAGFDRNDPVSVDVPVPNYLDALGGSLHDVKIGIPRNIPDDLIAPDVATSWQTAIEWVKAAGAEAGDIILPDFDDVQELWFNLSLPESLSWQEDDFNDRPEKYGDYTRKELTKASGVRAVDYVRARRRQALFARNLIEAMGEADVLLLPTTPTTAPKLKDLSRGIVPNGYKDLGILTGTTALTMPFNLSGQPAITVPTGLDRDGLPIGIQVVGRHFDEATILRVGAAIEDAANFVGVSHLIQRVTSSH